MNTTLIPLLSTLAGLFRSRAPLHLEVLALRQQLAMVTHRDLRRFRFRRRERLFWVWLYTLWPGCVDTLRILKPDTLVRWHRRGFRLYWTWRSRFRRGGRPRTPKEIRILIRRISQENPLWGAPRVHGELLMWGSRSPRPRCPGTWSAGEDHRRRVGGRFSEIRFRNSSASTCSQSPPSRFEFCTCSSYCDSSGAN